MDSFQMQEVNRLRKKIEEENDCALDQGICLQLLQTIGKELKEKRLKKEKTDYNSVIDYAVEIYFGDTTNRRQKYLYKLLIGTYYNQRNHKKKVVSPSKPSSQTTLPF